MHDNDSKAPGTADHQQILAALAADPSTLPPKLFYDRLGSTLFTAITDVPEYYPTRTEAQIFRQSGPLIADRMPAEFRLVDLGAGDCAKAASLFDVLKPAAYTPVDISGEFLQAAANDLQRQFPAIRIEPLVRDFTAPWTLPAEMLDRPIVFFYPGSSISNFTPEQAIVFLSQLTKMGRSQSSEPPMLLIGVDLVKDARILEAAYDDAIGVTAAFNRNILLNANRTLGTNFDPSQWTHRAIFNVPDSRIEMHLDAREDLLVSWPGGERQFRRGESIHTENSYKWTADSFGQLLNTAGFAPLQHFTDDQSAFLVVLAESNI